MKKVFLFLTLLFAVLLTSCNRTAKFDKNLQGAYYNMGVLYLTSKDIADKRVDIWHTAIYDGVNMEGFAISDFNEVLNDYAIRLRNFGKLDSLNYRKNRTDSITGKLADPPSDRKDTYDDFIKLAGEVNTLYNLAVSPTGSLQSYSANVEQQEMVVEKLNNEFKLKYSKILDK